MFPPILKLSLKILGALFVLVFAYFFVGYPTTYPKIYGITWSAEHAQHLGIDPYEGLIAVLDELHVKHLRIPAYWTRVEPKQGTFDWSSIDKQLDLIAARKGTVTLVVGAKQPRWPECWFPTWAKTVSVEERHAAQLTYAREVIKRYKDRPTITRWQIENEPTFFGTFGDCALYDHTIIDEEIAIVKQLDTTHRPISTTASGELSSWMREPKGIDLGFSVYRVISNSFSKRWSYWFFPSWLYGRKIALHNILRGGSMYVSEFQMEPWLQDGVLTTSVDDQLYAFDEKQMEKNLTYASHIDVPEVHFWGAEWWYWMKTKKGHPEFWERMKKVFDQKERAR